MRRSLGRCSRASRAHALERRRADGRRARRPLRPQRVRRALRHRSRRAQRRSVARGGGRSVLRRSRRRASRSTSPRSSARRRERARSYGMLVIPGLELTFNDPRARAGRPRRRDRAPRVRLRRRRDRGGDENGRRGRRRDRRGAPERRRAELPCAAGSRSASRATPGSVRARPPLRALQPDAALPLGRRTPALPAVASGDFHTPRHLLGWKTLLPSLHDEPAVVDYLRSPRPVYLARLDDELVSRGRLTVASLRAVSAVDVRTLPWSWYTDPAVLQLERERIFRRSWQYVGHPGEVRRARARSRRRGSATFPSWSSATVRTTLRAFLNVCRHRGSIVCEGRAGARRCSARTTRGRTGSTAG